MPTSFLRPLCIVRFMTHWSCYTVLTTATTPALSAAKESQDSHYKRFTRGNFLSFSYLFLFLIFHYSKISFQPENALAVLPLPRGRFSVCIPAPTVLY